MKTDDRLQFTEQLLKLKELAELQGRVLSKEQITDGFEGMELTKPQLDLIYEYLQKERIGIGEKPDLDDFLSEPELNYLELYLKELEELPQYTDGQKEAIYMAAIQKDAIAIEQAIQSFLSKVPEIAKLYVGQGVSIEDLIGEGNVALTVAAGMLGSQEKPEDVEELFAQMVMNSMQELVHDAGEQNKADEAMLHKMNRVMEAAKEIYETYLRKATMEEVAKETGISMKTIREIDMLCAGAIEFMESEFPKE